MTRDNFDFEDYSLDEIYQEEIDYIQEELDDRQWAFEDKLEMYRNEY